MYQTRNIMKILPKNIIAKTLILILILICILLALNYLTSVKIANNLFSKKDVNSTNFLTSYNHFEISNQGEVVKFYTIPNPANKDYILYISSSSGALNSVLNSMALNYNLVVMEYPSSKNLQNFEALKTIIETALNSDFFTEIDTKDIILFGHEIGANLALEIASKKDFKSVLLFNIIQGERDYCKSIFPLLICLTVNSSFDLEVQTNNSIYYFFNSNPFVKPDNNYNMFNSIQASEKFLLEIPGDTLNFNFNHILDFYLNESIIQNENFQNINQNENYEGEVKDIDGFLNPDEYLD